MLKVKRNAKLQPKINEERLKELENAAKITNSAIGNLKTEIQNYLVEKFDFKEFPNDSGIGRFVSFDSDKKDEYKVWYLYNITSISNIILIKITGDSVFLSIPTKLECHYTSGITFDATFNDKNRLTKCITLINNWKKQLRPIEKIMENNQILTDIYQSLDLLKSLIYCL